MDELAAALEHRPARAAPPEPRRPRPGLAACPTPASACSPATTARPSSPAGTGATSSASRSPTGCCAAWAARRRSGGAAAGRPRTRRCASTPTARALVTTGIQDIGTGTLTSARMVAAEELGLPLDRVFASRRRHAAEPLRPGRGWLDDDAVGHAGGPERGREGAPDPAPARRRRARDLRRRPRAPDGRIRSRDGALDVAVVEVTGKLGNATIDGSGARGPNPDGFRVQTFGCQIAQVAVDPGTGEVRVERVVAVHDVGRIVNPLGARRARSRAACSRASATPSPRSSSSTRPPASPSTAHLDDYKVPTIADMPEIVVDFVDVPDANLPNLGAKGLGEPPIIPTAAAIANAFAHATGRRTVGAAAHAARACWRRWRERVRAARLARRGARAPRARTAPRRSAAAPTSPARSTAGSARRRCSSTCSDAGLGDDPGRRRRGLRSAPR